VTFTIKFSRAITEALAVGHAPPVEFDEVAEALEKCASGDEIVIVGHVEDSEPMKAFRLLLNDSLRDFNKSVTVTVRTHS